MLLQFLARNNRTGISQNLLFLLTERNWSEMLILVSIIFHLDDVCAVKSGHLLLRILVTYATYADFIARSYLLQCKVTFLVGQGNAAFLCHVDNSSRDWITLAVDDSAFEHLLLCQNRA